MVVATQNKEPSVVSNILGAAICVALAVGGLAALIVAAVRENVVKGKEDDDEEKEEPEAEPEPKPRAKPRAKARAERPKKRAAEAELGADDEDETAAGTTSEEPVADEVKEGA